MSKVSCVIKNFIAIIFVIISDGSTVFLPEFNPLMLFIIELSSVTRVILGF